MKRFIYPSLVLFFVLLVSSCSSDDDGGASAASGDSIVGSWGIYEVHIVADFEDLGTFEETLSTSVCPSTPEVTFNADGSLVVTDFDLDTDFDDNEFCTIDGEFEGIWTFMGDGLYTLLIEGIADTVQIALGNNNNRIFITFDDQFFGGTTEYRGNRL